MEKRKVKTSIVWILCMVVLLIAGSGSPSVAAESSGRKTVRVGYYYVEQFQEGMSDAEEKYGYGYEYLQKLSYFTGWKYEYVYGSWQELYDQLVAGEIDMLAGISYSSEREAVINYPDYVMSTETYYIYTDRSDTAIIGGNMDTYSGKQIGVLRGSEAEDRLKGWLEQRQVDAEVVSYETEEELYDAVMEQRIEAIVASDNNAEVVSTMVAADEIYEDYYYLCTTKERQDLTVEMNAALCELNSINSAFTEELREKYYRTRAVNISLSSEERQWLDTHSELRIGYTNDYLPYCDTAEDGSVTGIITDVMDEMVKQLGIQDRIRVVYQAYDSDDAMLEGLYKQEVDVIFPCGGSLWQAEQNDLYQSLPVVTSGMSLAYKGTYRADRIHILAVNENNRMQYNYTITNYPDAEILYCDSIDACLNAVLKGKADGTVINALRAGTILKNNRYDTIMDIQLPQSDDRCFGVASGDVALLKILNRGVDALGTDYGLNASYAYAGELYEYTTMDFVRDHFFTVVGIFLVVIALIIYIFIRRSVNLRKQAVLDQQYKKELSEALEVAQHANKAKTTFLNNMSHDIRTPMNAIIGFTSLAATHIDNKEQVKNYLAKIMTSSNHLLSLINDILDMSRIESGQVKIEENECHLPTIMHDLRNILQSDVRTKRLNFFIDTVDVVDEDIICDKLRLNQVLLNCMSNAIKFTRPGGTVGIRICQKEGAPNGYANFEFIIRDTGIGMSPEFAEHIFEPFTREETSTVSGIPGTGLGMSITKYIIDMMGGTIQVKSKKDEGTEITIALSFRLGSKRHTVKAIRDLIGMRALVADDDMDTCVSVTRMLESIGMVAEWTMSGVEATYKAKFAYEDGKPYRAFIIDWLMPDMNGVEVVRRIRAEIGNDTPIIILTAYDWADIEEEARAAGVTAFCSKPIFLSDLYEILNGGVEDTDGSLAVVEPIDFTGKRVLLVEDNELNLEIAMEIIGRTGASIETAENGQQAVEKIQQSEEGYYDLVFMDIQMPVMDGYEATRQIRRLDRSDVAQLPIVAMTANAFAEDQQTAYEAGMNAHTAKPIEIKTLFDIMRKYL